MSKDKTIDLFEDYYTYLQLQQDTDEDMQDLLLQCVITCMHNCIQQGYTYTVDDICEILDVEDRFVRNTIVPNVLHVNVPALACEYFKDNLSYPFWKQRYLKWKKLFINKDCFIDYLRCNLKIVTQEKKDGVMQEIKQDIDEYLLNDILEGKVNLVRRCNVKDLVVKEKINKFFAKTVKDINRWKAEKIENTADKDEIKKIERRAEKELEELHLLNYKNINIKSYDKEVNDYLNVHNHVKLELVKDGNKKNPIIYIFIP